ncbi:hypothetical protein UY3_02299 [Chelonia mydas]|uniref:Uncharacterized protein n=1 Tax=Chelonia mydas TaxID=8469 RepID=M7BTC8_CHEMY|nr:hypothetical protein UY3_02299 [Chelonia mydas]
MAPTGRGLPLQANRGCGKRRGPRDVLAALPTAPIGLERRTVARRSQTCRHDRHHHQVTDALIKGESLAEGQPVSLW